MTKETIEAAVDAECPGTKDNFAKINVADLRRVLATVLARLLCPEPEKVEPPVAPAEKDRAAEMAEAITHQATYPQPREDVILGVTGRFAVPIPGAWASVDVLRNALADALRQYADEMLEKAINNIAQAHADLMPDRFHFNRALRVLHGMKSTAKGAANS